MGIKQTNERCLLEMWLWIREATQEKTEFLGNFFQMSDPLPLQPFWGPLFPKKNMVYLRFRSSGAFLVFTKMFISLFLHLLLGIGDPPPSQRKKFPKLLLFADFFQNFPDFELRVMWLNHSDITSPLMYNMFWHLRMILAYQK